MTTPITVAAALAARLSAMRQCEHGALTTPAQREWHDLHGRAIAFLITEYMPYGLGFQGIMRPDFDETLSNAGVLVFHVKVRHVDENGDPDGVTEHTLRVRPAFNGLDITCTGRNKNDILERLLDIYRAALLGKVIPKDEVAYLTVSGA